MVLDTKPDEERGASAGPATGDTDGGAGGQARVSILLLLPNIVTLVGMSFGLTAIRFATEGRLSAAVLLILLAALADVLDGLLARRFDAASAMGAQLDSLSDFLCFGAAPALMVYQLHLADVGGMGWIFALLFVTATCLRLARFNVMSGQADPSDEAKRHFVGVPAPAGAFLGILPVFLTLTGALDAGAAPALVSLWLAFVGLLMISKLKTPSLKGINVPRRSIAVILFATVVVIGLGFSRPWWLLVALDLAYLATVIAALIQARGRLFG